MASDTVSSRPVLENVMPKSDGPPYKCLICDQLLPRNSYTNYTGYQRHLLNQHKVDIRGARYFGRGVKGVTVERPFECDICGKVWKSKPELRHHMVRVHKVKTPPTGNPKVTNLDCIVCLKNMQRRQYNDHLKTDHNIDLQIDKLSFESKDGKIMV